MIFSQANFLALIRSAEGTPYLYGGTDPFGGGADCSGLIYWAGLQCGVTLPRTTTAEWAALPHSTNLATMPIAGCVEFEVPSDGGSPPQHVGVNVGGGFMIDDPETGMVVQQQVIPTEPGIIWPMGWVQLPFVTAPPPPSTKEYEIMDAVIAPNGDIVSHAVTPQGHYLEITRYAGSQGTPANNRMSIIDITAAYPQFVVSP